VVVLALLIAGCGGVKRDTPAIRAAAAGLEESSLNDVKRGDLRRARVEGERALAYYRSVDDTKGIAGALNRVGNLRAQTGDPDGARAAYLEALSLSGATGLLGEQAAAESNLGTLLEGQGDLGGAAEHYAVARDLATRAGDDVVLATALNNQAILARNAGRLDEARELLERALALDRKTKNRAGEATRWRNLGALHAVAGRRAEALDAFHSALDIDRQREDLAAIALDLVGSSEVRAQGGGELSLAVSERRRAQDIHALLERPKEVADDARVIDGWCGAIRASAQPQPPDCTLPPPPSGGSAPAVRLP
jgi:tetratricopeptide (TPR) repeat protein